MKYPNWVLLSVQVGAILAGVLVQSAAYSGMQQFSYPDNLILDLISTSSALGIVGWAVASVVLMRSRKVLLFTDEVVGELMQVAWPTREETLRASTTVVLTTFFTAAVLAAYDFFWKKLANFFLFTEG